MAAIWTIDSKTEHVISDPVDKTRPISVRVCATRTDGENATHHQIKMVLPDEKQEAAIAAALQWTYSRSVAKITASKVVVDSLVDATIVTELEKLEVSRG